MKTNVVELPLPPSQTSSTPSPHQVISDSIDATCQEILLLGEDATSESYGMLATRLSYYIELLDEDKLKEAHVRNRLLMAQMVINLCHRSAYPEDTAQGHSLIEFSDDKWKEFSEEMSRLYGIIQNDLSCEKVQGLYTAVKAQVEAMKLLVQLRSRLKSFLHQSNRVGESPELSSPKESIAEYMKHVGPLIVTLQTIHQTRYNGCFLPQKILASRMDVDTVDASIKSVTSFTSKIDGLVTKKAFPLEKLQVDFARLGKECIACLRPPIHFETGYFKDTNCPTEENSIQSEESEKEPASTPAVSRKKRSSSRVYPSSSEEESPAEAKKKATQPAAAKVHVKRKRDTAVEKCLSSPSTPQRKFRRINAKKSSPKRNDIKRDELDFDSDTETRTSVSSSTKRKRRVPYTEDEKRAVMEGVRQFGFGSWKEIRQYYNDVFKVNNRTNVNLKDLYRTLNK